MRIRTFYHIAILLPLASLAVAAVLHSGEGDLVTGLAPGGKARWIYPPSEIRGLLAYGIVALWLIWTLHSRPRGAFESLLWLAPFAYVAAHIALLAPLVLMHGRAAEFLSEHGGRVALRLLVRLLIGFGYVGLVVFVRERLLPSRATEAAEG
jgi:hypothetical protein